MDINTGLRLKMMREKRNMSQEELAAKMGYSSSSSIAKIETGASGIPHWKVARFAEILECNIRTPRNKVPQNAKPLILLDFNFIKTLKKRYHWFSILALVV